MDVASGIYKIENKMNGKIYIGSSIDMGDRWIKHRSELRGDYHPNRHLQNSWNKHGEENFFFESVENMSNPHMLLHREQFFLDNIVRWGFDYNIAKKAGKPPSRKGVQITDEHRKKISGRNSHMWGKKVSKEFKDNISRKNSKFSDDDVLKIRKEYSSGRVTKKELAEKYTTNRNTISSIISGKRYSWVKKLFGNPATNPMIGRPRCSVSEEAKKKMATSHNILSDENVLIIRNAYVSGKTTMDALSKDFSVSIMTVSNLINGKTYKHLPLCKKVQGKHIKLSDEDILKITEIKDSFTQRELGKMFGVSHSTINSVLKGKRTDKIIESRGKR